MSFETDKQTLDDLNLLGKYKNNSDYSMFVGTITRGGERMMENMFLHPLTNAKAINERSSVFRYFRDHDFGFPFGKDEFDVVEQYITGASSKHGFRNIFQILKAKSMHYISNDPEFNILRDRILMSIKFFQKACEYFDKLAVDVAGNPFQSVVEKGRSLLKDSRIDKLLGHPRQDNPGLANLISFDRVFRCLLNKQFKEVIELLQGIDVNVVVGGVAKEKDFCFATAADEGEVLVAATGLHHPRIDGAISNDLEVTKSKNIFFLTGANMAGKSTLMKSFGIAVYMGHMGFPIAAKTMQFRIQDGMYTSINVPDNINLGYSHFYAEVLRVKKVAEEVSKSKRLVVIFDELFKGTNVKDAYDATLAVTEALAKRRACSFLISTHIIEVGQDLGRDCDNVTFAYLPTVMEGKVPTYTYKLREGITSDKHGMIIINNERIIDIIRGKIS
mgnify:CR=1 FL=1